jgi:YfdX protein
MKGIGRARRVLSAVGIGALVVGIAAGLFWMVESVASAKPKVTSWSNVTAESTLTAKEQKEVSRAASRMLKHIYQARQAVAKKDKRKALRNVKQALQLSRIIKHVMPKYSIHTKMKSGKLVYDNQETVQPLRVTLFEELDQVDILEPIRAARRSKRTRSATSDDVVVAADLAYSRVRIDVGAVTAELWKTKYYLERAKWDRADKGLLLGQASVSFEEDLVAMPLVKAADNIALAQEMITSGHNTHTARALEVASTTLQRYHKQAGKDRKKDVEKLQVEIKTLRKKMASGKALSAGEKAAATKQAQGWWNTILPWRSEDDNVCIAPPAGNAASKASQRPAG